MAFKNITIIHVASQTVLSNKVIVANNFFLRLRGMLFRAPLAAGEAIIISPCQQIHTHFMTYALDVVFLDSDYKVCFVVNSMQPWKMTKFIKAASHVLELPAGAASMIKLGDHIQLA